MPSNFLELGTDRYLSLWAAVAPWLVASSSQRSLKSVLGPNLVEVTLGGGAFVVTLHCTYSGKSHLGLGVALGGKKS